MASDTRRETVDLLVVGASVGGLAAAITAADQGLRAIVVERAKGPGGTARMEPERIAAAGTAQQQAAGVSDSSAVFSRDWLAAVESQVAPELVTALVEQSGPLVEWLESRCSLPLTLAARYAAPGHSAARLHLPGEVGGADLLDALTRVAHRVNRVGTRFGTTADRLLRGADGKLCGVVVKFGRKEQELVGPVLLACGGFVGSDALVTAHCPEVAELPYIGTDGPAGEGLRLGGLAGAQTARMAAARITPLFALPTNHTVTAPLLDLGAMLVNQLGRRFVNETLDPLVVARAVRAQPGKMAYVMFDERIVTAARDADPYFGRVVLPRAARHASLLADLARQFGMPDDVLPATVATYNDQRGGGDAFGRAGGPTLGEPYHAIRVTAVRRRTVGGLVVDPAGRVLDANGTPIPGLYATGGAAVGLAGDGPKGALEGTDALVALGLGRLAALDVVARRAAAVAEPAATAPEPSA
jgi:fumarate reductase flavoprotein subunit